MITNEDKTKRFIFRGAGGHVYPVVHLELRFRSNCRKLGLKIIEIHHRYLLSEYIPSFSVDENAVEKVEVWEKYLQPDGTYRIGIMLVLMENV